MLLAHAPALVQAIRSATEGRPSELGVAGVVGLSLANLLFVLKILDVSWLRFKTDRRSCCTVGLAIALMHVNVLNRSAHLPLVAPNLLLTTHVLVFGSLPVIRRLTCKLFHMGYLRNESIRVTRCWYGYFPQRFPGLSRQWLGLALIAPRAPPHCCC